MKASCEHVELIDEVMYDFPDLIFVTRHGCEPWTELAVKLDAEVARSALLHERLRSHKYYPKNIIDYANSCVGDKIIYAGYFLWDCPWSGSDHNNMANYGFKDDVWPKFLPTNALRFSGRRRPTLHDDARRRIGTRGVDIYDNHHPHRSSLECLAVDYTRSFHATASSTTTKPPMRISVTWTRQWQNVLDGMGRDQWLVPPLVGGKS